MSAVTDPAAALQKVAQIGPYFATQQVAGPGWHPMAALLGEPAVNGAVVDATRRDLASRHAARLSSVELRVAASIHFLDVAARLVSPVLAAGVLADTIPTLTPRNTWWRPRRSGALTIGITAAAAEQAPADPEAAAAQLQSALFEPLLAPLARVYRQRFGLGEVLLWGNVASAVVGAAGQVAARSGSAAGRVDALVAALLRTVPLAGSVRRPPPDFLRNSCCLYYRLPDGALCGDCVLRVKREAG
jgi:ferric iron reductase protein FhuF